ncbi:MAG: hypothetical protein GHHEDOFH_02925 [Pseudorhodoplanes sp.]|nr:hypothetical protein [Pseudorhodoplanes sp.]
MGEKDAAALCWLEELSEASAPIIAAPSVRATRGFANYVPNNNDMAIKNGTLKRIGKEKTDKLIKPLLFDAHVPLLYAWLFEQGEEHEERARAVCAMAERLYQLGRGVDMAWAWGEIVDAETLEERLGKHGGAIYRPARSGDGNALLCPFPGSLDSLIKRHEKASARFAPIMVVAPTKKDPARTKQAGQTFSQAPKPRFAAVAYNSPPRRLLFELRNRVGASSFSSWPLAQAAQLVENVRDCAAQKLKKALPDRAAIIERVFIGRDTTEPDKAARIRIVPLPSIGSPHVARAIRRVLVEVLPNCPLAAEDIGWAFSGLDLNLDYETGEISDHAAPVLVAADDESMLRHYGVDDGSAGHRVWRTVTPAALPEQAARRRIDPRKVREELVAARDNPATEFKEAKPGRERLLEEGRAASAVIQVLRHVGVTARPDSIRVQREPFEGKGARAEAFAPRTRFAKERLWHVEIAFVEPTRVPLAIGDGRYLGLGLMAPVPDASRDALMFAVPEAANIGIADGPALVRAARRALMALASNGEGRILRLFSGHEPDGRPAGSGRQEHVFLAADDNDGDGRIDRLIVAAPWACDRSLPAEGQTRKIFDGIVSRLEVVRAGRLGVITLGPPRALAGHDPLVGPARVWQSRTRYRATRHAGRRKDPAEALVRDLVSECLRRDLPRPEVEILKFSTVPNGGGLVAQARLRFAVAVHGPLLLGRDSHKGGGVFAIEA